MCYIVFITTLALDWIRKFWLIVLNLSRRKPWWIRKCMELGRLRFHWTSTTHRSSDTVARQMENTWRPRYKNSCKLRKESTWHCLHIRERRCTWMMLQTVRQHFTKHNSDSNDASNCPSALHKHNSDLNDASNCPSALHKTQLWLDQYVN